MSATPLLPHQPQTSPAAQPPTASITADIYSDDLKIRSDTPGKTRTFKIAHILISTFHFQSGESIVITTRRRPHELSQAVSKWWTKWLHRICAALLWLIFASYTTQDQGVIGLALDRIWAPGKTAWEGPALLTLIAILLIASWISGSKNAGLAALYILFFPITALFIITTKAIGIAGLIKLSFSTLGSLLVTGANWILIFVACIIIDRTSADWLIVACTVFLAASAIYIALSNFYWVTTPFQSIANLATWVQRIAWATVDENQKALLTLTTKHGATRGTEDRLKIRQEIIKEAETIQGQAKSALSVVEKAKTITGGKIVLFYAFAFRFLASLAAIVLIFAGIYRGISRLLPDAFSGGGIQSLWFSFYYSVVTFFTVGDGSVAPRVFLSQLAVVSQIIFALIILTVLGLSFSTLSMDIAQENGILVANIANKHFEACMDIMKKRLGTTKTSPAEALEDLQQNFDKHMRRIHRKKALDDDAINNSPSNTNNDS